ncbi:MAG: phosphate acetyltransferase [Gammaproteobacteria bacterium]|jgi:phosphate acetyltransferase
MNTLDKIVKQAQSNRKTIVLAEGDDIRVIQAAVRATNDGIANCVLVGSVSDIEQMASKAQLSLDGISIADPHTSVHTNGYAQTLLKLRAKKGMTQAAADEVARDSLYFADLMLQAGDADGSIAGARYSTGDRVRSALQVIGVGEGFKTVSSFFLMLFEAPHHDPKRAMVFSDCAMVVDPSAEQLAEIALAAATNITRFLNTQSRVAMLSFSTNGSANHPFVDKVREATLLLRQLNPALPVDGDIQLDAAIIPSVAAQKLPHSNTGGEANVLIFPDLNAANIGYKIAQRMGGATAIGPIMQGLNKPANDLSRGCSADDVYYLIALTAVQAQ